MTHNVMRCVDWDPSKVQFPGCFSPKVDDVRAFYYPGESALISRQEKPIYGMGHIMEELRRYEDEFDLAIFIPGMEWNKASGLIRNHEECPEARAAIIDSPSNRKPLINRLAELPVAFPKLDINAEVPLVSIIPHYKVQSWAKLEELYARFLANGYEGGVYKTLHHKYRNARHPDWMRKVPTLTADVRVVKMYEGQGKMKGMAGGFYVEWKGGTCKVGTMKDVTYDDRIDMFWNEADYIGRIAEIHFKSYQPSGKPRQPTFKRWRDDKDETYTGA